MTFDSKAFLKTEFVAREETVAVPALKDWFKDKDPVWRVRGLTTIELNAAQNAVDKNNLSISVAEVLAGNDAEVVNDLKERLGLSNSVPAEIVRQLEYLVLGSIDPIIDTRVAGKIAEVAPVEFKILVNKIVELTGLGMAVKKK